MALPVIQFMVAVALAIDVRDLPSVEDADETIDSVHYQTVLLAAAEVKSRDFLFGNLVIELVQVGRRAAEGFLKGLY